MRAAIIIGAVLLSGCTTTIECDVAPPNKAGAPSTLTQTGLHCEDSAEVSSGVIAYEPAFTLWSDGMRKRRWIQLPESGTIDTSDMDHWSFPIGTRLWKEVADDARRIETRLAERWGPDDTDWNFATYRWREDQADAVHLPDGEKDVHGTDYDVPADAACGRCHNSLTERVLGFSAIQLATESGRATASELAGRFSRTPDLAPVLADDPSSRAALGVLHANCGNCHHDGPMAVASTMDLRLRVGTTKVEDTSTFRTTVGVPTDVYGGLENRIMPGDAGASAVFFRLSSRGNPDQMPPLGTDHINHGGSIAVGTWINKLSQ